MMNAEPTDRQLYSQILKFPFCLCDVGRDEISVSISVPADGEEEDIGFDFKTNIAIAV